MNIQVPQKILLRSLLTILFGQIVSMVGSRMTRFALGVWVYQVTSSVAQFSLMMLFMSLPSLLISPVLGVYIDRVSRRKILILCDIGGAVVSLLLVALSCFNLLNVYWVYLIVMFSASFDSLRIPAFSAAIVELSPKEHLARVNGMFASADAVSRIVAPLFGGLLLSILHLIGIAIIDSLSFITAAVTLIIVPFTSLSHSEKIKGKVSVWVEVMEGWRYLRNKHGLLRLVQFFAAKNFILGVFTAMFTPMVLGFGTDKDLGVIMSLGSLGMLVGGLVVSIWGGPERKIQGIFLFSILAGVAIVLSALQPSVIVCSLAIFLFLFCQPIVNSCSQTIIQRKTKPALQGRVFAMVHMTVRSMEPLAYLVAGVITPVGVYLLSQFKEYEKSFFIDIAGRPISAIFVLLGLLMVVVVVLSGFSRSLVSVESELSDIV